MFSLLNLVAYYVSQIKVEKINSLIENSVMATNDLIDLILAISPSDFLDDRKVRRNI